MIDLRRLADDEAYRAGAVRKGANADAVGQLLDLESRRRSSQSTTEELRARQNAASKEIGRAAPEDRPARIEEAGRLKDELATAEDELRTLADEVRELALTIPNPAHESVPDGGEDDAIMVHEVGEQTEAPPRDHAEYAEAMGFIDLARGARTSGSRFAYLLREAALVELALVQYAMRTVVEAGFVPVVPPTLVTEDMMVDAGFFPTDRNQVYELERDALHLVGTAEVPLAGIHRQERLAADELPLRYAGFSSCFRREAGTYGKDTRGIFRVHQFDKVEMFSYVAPDDSWDELERLRELQETIIGGLGLPYRVVNIAAGDLGAAAAKKYDLEAWLPSEGRYREITSCSNYLDFSARRLDCRVAGAGFAHTLNGTACAISRTLVFLFEHGQQADGSWVVPEVLRPWTGFDVVEPR
ncbi:MAG: serine--tRNA ligase [Actinomycetota bacterium]